ncbi:hypothetical protein ACT7DA_09820 [Bacillus pacificus]
MVYEENGLTDKNFNLLMEENPYIKTERKRFKKGFKTYKPWNMSIQFNELKQPNISFKKEVIYRGMVRVLQLEMLQSNYIDKLADKLSIRTDKLKRY